MCDIAAALGSDVPVCVASAPAFMEGRGEILTPCRSLPRLPMLLVNPGVAVPTKDVFAALDRPQRRGHDAAARPLPRPAPICCAFWKPPRNDLEAPARALQPVIGEVLAALRRLPGALFARMSGSGATCFALVRRMMTAAGGQPRCCKAKHPGWWIAADLRAGNGPARMKIAASDIGPTPDGL